MTYGVHQGSVLGPILYNIYTTPLVTVLNKHGVKFHMYADDIQLYVGLDPKSAANISETVASVENCLSDIKFWMSSIISS